MSDPWSLTIYKSQASTFENVFIDLSDIINYRDSNWGGNILFFANEIYTSITRASNKIIFNGNFNIFKNTLNREKKCIKCNSWERNFDNEVNLCEFCIDIGNNKCDICAYYKKSSILYIQKEKRMKICKKCYKKMTKKNSRIEKVISDYLDEIPEIKPFLIGTDISFKKMGGCSLKRPDKLYVSHNISLWVEIDEFQHKMSNGSYMCDEKRISNEFDNLPQNKLIVIRINPHKYKKKPNKTLLERLNHLKNLILHLIKNPPQELIKIFYLYYDKDNPRLSKNIPFELIY